MGAEFDELERTIEKLQIKYPIIAMSPSENHMIAALNYEFACHSGTVGASARIVVVD